MKLNPYEAPRAVTETETNTATDSVERRVVLWRVRWALMVLLIPGVYNFVCFNFPVNQEQLGRTGYNVFFPVNLLGLIVIVLAGWFGALLAFEFATSLIHRLFARRSEQSAWTVALHKSLRWIWLYAILGAIIWWDWINGFYGSQLGFYKVSLRSAILAHLLAASFYVPLFYRWYQIEQKAKQSDLQTD